MQKVLDMSLNNGAMKVMNLEGPNAFYTNMLTSGSALRPGSTWPVRPISRWRRRRDVSMLDYARCPSGRAWW